MSVEKSLRIVDDVGNNVMVLDKTGFTLSNPSTPLAGFLPTQVGQSGKYLTTNGLITNWGSITGIAGTEVYRIQDYGTVDITGVVDSSAAVLAAIAAANAANGGVIAFPSGTILINSQIVFPNDGVAAPNTRQKSFRLTGAGSSKGGVGAAPLGGTILQLGYTGAVAKIDTRARGYLEIDHLTLVEPTISTTTPFIQTTSTTLSIHEVEIVGAQTGLLCGQDAIVLGGTGTVEDGTATAPFLGYGTNIYSNYVNHIRRFVYLRTYANAITVTNNTIMNSSGSNITTSISAATNASPTVLTATAHGIPLGSVISLTLSGFTGNWTPLNGTKTITVVNANSFSIATDATAFGALTGTPLFYSGAAIELLGISGSADSGNYFAGNLIEESNYPFVFKADYASENTFIGNGLFDPLLGTTIAHYAFTATAGYNLIIAGFHGDVQLFLADLALTNTGLNAHQSQTTTWTQPWRWVNTVTWQDGTASPQGPRILDSSNNLIYWQMFSGNHVDLATIQNGLGVETLASVTRLALNQTDVSSNGSTAAKFSAPNAATMYIQAKAGSTLGLGDVSNPIGYYILNNGLYSQNTGMGLSFRMANTGGLGWSSTSAPGGGNDLAVGRNAAGVLEINSGVAGTLRDLTLRTITATGAITALSGTGIPAGGTAGSGLKVSSVANFGVFFGSGVPTLSAAQGSLYLRSDGSTGITRAYVNTDGGTTWTAITTVA